MIQLLEKAYRAYINTEKLVQILTDNQATSRNSYNAAEHCSTKWNQSKKSTAQNKRAS